MDDGLILAGLLLTILAVPLAIIIGRARARSSPELSGLRIALPMAFCFSFVLAAVWMLRITTCCHRSEDYGSIAALFFGVITVPFCFVATFVAAMLTVRHVQRNGDE